LVGFTGDQVEVRGYVELRTTFSDDIAARTIIIRYIIVNVSSVEPSGVQALKNPNPLKDVEALVVLVVAVLF